MKTKYVKVLTIAALILLVLNCMIVGIGWFRNNLILVDGRPYPKTADFLDLRGQEISVSHYEALREIFPDIEILWDIPFQGERYDSSIERLIITSLSEEDIAMLMYFTDLKQINANGCQNYRELTYLREAYPSLDIEYRICIDGTEYPWGILEISLTHLTDEDVENMKYLPNLVRINAEGCEDYGRLAVLRKSYPDCSFSYYVIVDGQRVGTEQTELTFRGMDAQKMADLLVHFPDVKRLDIVDPVGNAETLVTAMGAMPELKWNLIWKGCIVSQEETLDLSSLTLSSIDEVETILSFFPDVSQVYLGMPDIENEVIAAFRESQREKHKIIWTVMCGEIPVRTDAVYFHPVQEHVYYFYDEDCQNLKYCEDMVCVDVGHMSITHCDWVRYMPRLKYLVLGVCGQLKDISALASCKELVFLELEATSVRDYSPLLECTALEDLNLGNTYGDPEIIAQMTWLKNLWWTDCHSYARSMLREALPNTTIEIGSGNPTSRGWRRLENYYAMRDVLNMPYMD